MFRILIFLIIVALFILFVFSLSQLFKKSEVLKDDKKTTSEEIESLINDVKVKILRAELDQLNGIEGATKEIENLKTQLTKIQELKEKTKNL